jgi:dienelactone hydrolase
VIDYLRTQPFVAPTRTIVVGHSAGGWGAMALSATNPPGVAGMVNFAGGRGGRCTMPNGGYGVGAPETLIAGAAQYGSTARVPMLWIYAANDSYFNPALARRMADAYNGAGGHADLKQVGTVGDDGHQLVSLRPGLAVWQPLLGGFLKDK